MRQAAGSDPLQPGSGLADAGSRQQLTGEAVGAQRISFLNALGEKREGFVLKATRWDESVAAELQRTGGDFRIVLLREPTQGPIQPPPATVVCAPARPLERPAAVRETAAAYQARAEQLSQPLTPAEAELLAQGRLYAPTPLTTMPQEVFGGGKPRFERLARDLLTCEALAGYLGPLAVALSAPDAPPRSSPQELVAALRQLSDDAQAALRGLDRNLGPEATGALDRLSRLCAAGDVESFLAWARRLYPQVPALLEEVYLLRALAQRLPQALELLAMRTFVTEAVVPPTEPDLALDRAIAVEQLQFASIVPEPQRLNTARLALDLFRDRYRARYQAHHRAYWTEMARLHTRLLEARGYAEALRKLNTLTELGPPVGEGALAAYGEFLKEASGCPLILGVEDGLGDRAVCPGCQLRLEQQPPAERASEILQRLQ